MSKAILYSYAQTLYNVLLLLVRTVYYIVYLKTNVDTACKIILIDNSAYVIEEEYAPFLLLF